MIFPIPDPKDHKGTGSLIRIRYKNISIFNSNIFTASYRKYDAGYADFSTPDAGVKKTPYPGSGSATVLSDKQLQTTFYSAELKLFNIKVFLHTYFAPHLRVQAPETIFLKTPKFIQNLQGSWEGSREND
jgi:hypothetical protein